MTRDVGDSGDSRPRLLISLASPTQWVPRSSRLLRRAGVGNAGATRVEHVSTTKSNSTRGVEQAFMPAVRDVEESALAAEAKNFQSKRRRRDHRLAHAEGEQPGSPTRAIFACWGGNAKPEAWVSWQIEIERRRCGTGIFLRASPVAARGPGGARKDRFQTLLRPSLRSPRFATLISG